MNRFRTLSRKFFYIQPQILKKIIYYVHFISLRLPTLIYRIVSISKYNNSNGESYLNIFWGSSNLNSINRDNDKLPNEAVKYFMEAINIKLNYEDQNDSFKLYSYEFENINSHPGEHYRYLAAICKIKQPKSIIEIGTGSGISTKILHEFSDAKVYSFDIFDITPNNSYLTEEEINSNKLDLINENLIKKEVFQKYKKIIENADLIFLDASKSGILEDKLLKNFTTATFKNESTLLVIDDIKFLTMFKVWEKIKSEKFDASSLAHWSGTGLVHIVKKLKYD